MSSEQYQKTLNTLDKEIATLEKKKATAEKNMLTSLKKLQMFQLVKMLPLP